MKRWHIIIAMTVGGFLGGVMFEVGRWLGLVFKVACWASMNA